MKLLLATLAAVIVVTSAGPAVPRARAAVAPLGQAAVTDPLPLLELTNPQGVHFYTLSRAEADAAVAGHGFRLHPSRTGYARQTAFAGSQPLFRLARTDGAGWLVTPSGSERDQLVASGRFRYEGVLGHWWAGVRDYSGRDPSVPQYKGVWPDADFSDRQPALGFYDDAQTATVERHITQASSAGLDHFAFYWYWNPQLRAESHGVGLRSFLRARNRAALDFAVTICAHSWDNGVLKIPVEQYGEVAAHLVGDYLSQPNYLRANDGRRVVWLCDTRGIGSGSADDVKHFTNVLRGAARTTLKKEILVLAHQDLGLQPASVGADGDYCAAPYHAVSNRSYQSYVDGQRNGFARGSQTFVRCVMSDFDERPRYPISKPDASTVYYFPDQSFDLFARAARNAYADVAASARTSVVDNFVLVYAWNEWHEGGYIEPNARDGSRYLDILRAELRLTAR